MLKSVLRAAAAALVMLSPTLSVAQAVPAKTANPAPTIAATPANTSPAATRRSSAYYIPTSGKDLLGMLQNCNDNACMGYVSGVVSGISVYAVLAGKPSPFCVRGDVSNEQIRQAIISALQSKPDLQGQNPAIAVLAAFGTFWPCMTQADIASLQSTSMQKVDPAQIKTLMATKSWIINKGDKTAGPAKTIIVFHDPNCPHCQMFSKETDTLVLHGWHVIVFPVALSSEASTGYSAVEVALKSISPKAVDALYRNDGNGKADMAMAMKIAQEQGVSTNDILTAIATSNAYNTVKSTTAAFKRLGGKMAPSWIVWRSLVTGYLTANAIENIASSNDVLGNAPTPSGKPTNQPAKME